MTGPRRRQWRAVVVAAGTALLLSACGTSAVAPAPLERSVAATFTNLYILDQVEQGDPRPSAGALDTTARCQKGTPATPQRGAGNDWVCFVTYLVDGPGTPVTATYNLDVQTDGCYAADGDGPISLNGSRTITGPGYVQIVNPLWLMDGCFDVI